MLTYNQAGTATLRGAHNMRGEGWLVTVAGLRAPVGGRPPHCRIGVLRGAGADGRVLLVERRRRCHAWRKRGPAQRLGSARGRGL